MVSSKIISLQAENSTGFILLLLFGKVPPHFSTGKWPETEKLSLPYRKRPAFRVDMGLPSLLLQGRNEFSDPRRSF